MQIQPLFSLKPYTVPTLENEKKRKEIQGWILRAPVLSINLTVCVLSPILDLKSSLLNIWVRFKQQITHASRNQTSKETLDPNKNR